MDFETNGVTIVKRIDELLKKQGITRVQLAPKVGISPATISAWYTRGTVPAADVAIKIAAYLDVSVEWLITGHDPEGLTEDDRKILDMYHLLDERDREDVLGIIEGKLERSTLRQEAGTEKSGLVG
jgi:transcriptional regulator with XRE-family HTH domain